MLVGEILDVLFGLLLVVLGQFALLLGLLDVVDCVAADVADGDLGILGVFADLLREILAALLGQLREDEADNAAVILRVDAEIRGLDGLFDGLEKRAIPRLDDERAGIGGRDGADLVDGARLAVVLHRDAVEHLRVGAARAHSGEVGCENVERFFHFALEFLEICHVIVPPLQSCRSARPSRRAEYSAGP